MEPINTETIAYTELPTDTMSEKETTSTTTPIPSRQTLEKVRAEEKHRIAEVTRSEKSQEIHKKLNKFIETIKMERGKIILIGFKPLTRLLQKPTDKVIGKTTNCFRKSLII